jgi:site-specific recombinase XerD
MSVIFDQYEERLHRLKRHPNTIRSFKGAARELEDYLKAHRIKPESVESHHLEEYFAQLDKAPTTKELHLTHVGAAYRYAQRRGLVQRDPTVDVLLERVPDKEPRIIPNQKLREMKERLLNDREWMLWHLLTYTGMRRLEIVNLMWSDVKLADGTITVIGKGGKLRHIPIHPALGEVLTEREHHPDGWVLAGREEHGEPRQVSLSTFHGVVDCMTKKEYTAHDFRRTVASSMYHNGVDGDTIDKIMGWSPRVIRTRFYQSIAGERLQQAILKLYADDPI